MTAYTLTTIAEFGDFLVYVRGKRAKQEGLPLYVVGRESDGRLLEEFSDKAGAVKWAAKQECNA